MARSHRTSPARRVRRELSDPWAGLAWAGGDPGVLRRGSKGTRDIGGPAKCDDAEWLADVCQTVYRLLPIAVLRLLAGARPPSGSPDAGAALRLDPVARRAVPPLWRDCLALLTGPDLRMQHGLRMAEAGDPRPFLVRYHQIQPFARVPWPNPAATGP